jgi:hypothetical protein
MEREPRSSLQEIIASATKTAGKILQKVVNMTDDEEEEPRPKASIQLRNRVSRNFGGRKRQPKKKVMPGGEALQRMIQEAEYEVNHDPYRGMVVSATATTRSQQNKENSASPWRRCGFGSALKGGGAEDSGEDGSDANNNSFDHGKNLVQSVCQSSCPSLIAWENEEHQKQNKKKKRKNAVAVAATFAARPDDLNSRCACDYNPFCLGTLGGVMNEALMDRMKEFEGEPEEEQDDEDDDVVVLEEPADSNQKLYSETTLRELKRVRKALNVDVDPVQSYLTEILKDMASSGTIDDCLRSIENWHGSLVFSDPRLNADQAPNADRVGDGKRTLQIADQAPKADKDGDGKRTLQIADQAPKADKDGDEKRTLQLSLPPGIENLGATCYLNTQLQCLAQNRVFTQGMLSWRPGAAKEDDRMTSVIRLFQELLARMNAGPNSVLNTVDFSNALGLDHHEQQDPNEFSRLFFDKLHESFQNTADANEDGCDLRGLLPNLFQGMTTYETTCLTCNTTSQRKEEFMDLNLPIVAPPNKAPTKTGQQTMLEALTPKMDTGVQHCFDSYCSAETLEGDNQYWCSQCECKRDAKREMSFEKLPPVLNVQL